MPINAAWHKSHPMPRNATPEQRASWHQEHQKHCACRPAPAGLAGLKGSAKPKATEPKIAKPKATEPKIAKSKAATPKTSAKKTTEPKTTAKKTAVPKTTAKKAAAPRASAKKAAAPKAAKPKAAAAPARAGKSRRANKLDREVDVLERFRSICLSLPEATEVEAWGHPTFRVRNKIFASIGAEQSEWSIGVKTTPELQAGLVASDPRFSIARYVGKHGWVHMLVDERIDWSEVLALVNGSYRLIAPKALAARVPE